MPCVELKVCGTWRGDADARRMGERLAALGPDDRTIVENDDFYVFAIGARESIIDGDVNYAIAGGVPIVYKIRWPGRGSRVG